MIESPRKVTLVTAFYPIKSKFPTDQYMKWATNFMKLQAPIVMFTTPELVKVFKQLRNDTGPLYIIAKPFEELDSWVLYRDEWVAHHAMDHEKEYHTPELYAVWAQKAFFVEQVATLNPYETDYFFWCDIGAFRGESVEKRILERFPSATNLPRDRILLSAINPLTAEDQILHADGIRGEFSRVNKIVGGLWGGGKDACIRWKAAYEQMLIRYFAANRFAGKDQSVMLSAFLQDPGLATVVRCNVSDIDTWFYLEYLLSDIGIPFEPDATYLAVRHPEPPVSVSIKGGLGNQMFEIASVFAHAKHHGVLPQLLRRKVAEDGRDMYWSSMLHRWQHMLADTLPVGMQRYDERSSTEYTAIPPPPSHGQYVEGYLQSSKYFGDATTRKEIRLLMRPSASTLLRIQARYRDLLDARDRVVVVHARRTDYLKNQHNIDFHGPLTTAYYNSALAVVQTKIEQPIYLLVSDDPLYWIQSMSEIPALQTNEFRFLNDESDIGTLAILQEFRTFVLANSTFSWWAAWLAEGPKTVVVPARWFGPAAKQGYEDIYEADWIRV
jgi:hypothetical protein